MKRILVVDDIAENRYLLEATLQAYGYEVISANDGAEALACARRHPPDLVISDILMPVMDGFALCRQWRAEEPLRGIPFIFYTATYTDARDEQLAMDVGADRFVIKPQEPQVMQAIIQELLARGAKNLAVPVAVVPRADESVTLREYNEVLVRKLEKKVADLEATREVLEENIRQRHQVEAALRRSEERWRLIFDTEPECVKVVSAEGTLVDMNPAGLAMIGARSLDEVRSKSVLDLVTPEHRDAVLAMHRDVLAGQSRRLVFEVIGLNGTRRWLESHEVPLPNADGTISLLGITRDITERKRAEAALLASEQRFRALIDHSFDAISLVDQDGIFLYGSASATRITGQASEEYLGKSAFERIHPDDLQHVRDLFAELLSNPEQTQRSQFRFRHKDESWIWLEATATNLLNQPAVQAIVVNYRDITERLRAEAALAASEARFRAIVERGGDAFFMLDANGAVIFDSPATDQNLGYSEYENLGRSSFELVHPDDQQTVRSLFARLLKEPNTDVRWQFQALHRNGSWRWIDVIACNRLADPNLQGIVVSYRDITERRRAEEESLRFGRILDDSLNEIYIFDAVSLRFDRVNIGAQLNLRYTMEELRQLTPLDLKPEFNQESFEALVEPLRAGQQQRIVFETIHRRKDGSTYPVEVHLQLANGNESSLFVAIIQDITERRRAEEALRESNERFLLVAKATNDAVWDWNLATDIGWWNDGIFALFGYRREQKPPESIVWNEHLHPEDRDRVLRGIHAVINGGGQSWIEEYRIIRADGSIAVVFDRGFVLRDSTGKAYRMIGAAQDITARKRAEEALRESEARYRLLADNTDDFVVLNDTQGNRLYVSPSYFRVTGWTLEELQRTDWRTRMHPDDLPMIERTRAANLAGESTLIEHRIRCKDGSWIWVELRCKPLTGPDGRVNQMLQWSRDITARKRAETALVESEQRFRELFENSRDAIFVEDFAGQVRDVNPAACRLHGLTREQLLSKNARDLVPQNQRAIFDCDFPRLLSDELTQIEGFSLRADGTAVPVELSVSHVVHSGQPSLLLHVRDITARKRAEQAVLGAERQLRRVLNTLPAMVGILAPDGTLLDGNQLPENIFGVQLEAVIGRPFADLYPWCSSPALQGELRDALRIAAEGEFVRYDVELPTRLKQSIAADIWISPLKDETGLVTHLIVSGIDITERKRAETALADSERQLASLVSNLPGMVYRCANDPQWTMTFVSAGAEQLTGYRADELFENRVMGFGDLVHPDDRDWLWAKCQHSLETRVPCSNEYRIMHRDGTVRWVWDRASGHYDENGTLLLIEGYIADITERKRVQDALLVSEERYRRLFEQNLAGVFQSTVAGKIIDCNAAFVKMFGYESKEELRQCPAENLYPTHGHRTDYLALLRSKLELTGLEIQLKRKDGQLIWGFENVALLSPGSPPEDIIQGTIIDITQMKRAEEALRESEGRLRLLVQASNIGLWDWNLITNEVFYSPEWKQQLGYSGDEVSDHYEEWESRLHPDDLARALAAVSDFRAGRRDDYDVEFRLRHKDGSWRWILTRADMLRDPAGQPIRMMGCHVDITERKRIQAALVEERNLLRTLVDHIPDFIFVKDTQSRQLLNNAANLRLVGARNDAEIMGKTVFDLYPREQAQRYFDEDQRVMRSGQAQLNQEESVLDQDGQEHWMLSSKVPLRDVHGNCIGLVGIKRDITEHRRANTELSASRKRLELLSRQLIAAQESERRHLARELHDEIGQALTAIKLNLKALQQPTLSPKSSSLVQDTIGVVDQTLQQVRNLALDLRPSMLDDIGLVAALRWCLDRQSQRAGFVPHFVADSTVSGATQEIETACFRIVQESLTNIARHAKARNVRVDLRQHDSELELLVQDDGIGFDVLAARDRAAHGASVGLLGMTERVELVGGQIEIESIPSQGTTIRARIPITNTTNEGRDSQ